MKLGMELLASRTERLRLGTFFELWIATPEGTLRRSLGRDEYHLGLTILPGRRLAATGRIHTCQLDLEAAELGPNQARPATLVEAGTEGAIPLVLGIRTNLFINLADLVTGCRVRLLRDTPEALDLAFDHPLVVPTEVAPGRFVVDVSGLLTGEGASQ